MYEGGVNNHLCPKPGVTGHEACQLTVVYIRPVHPALHWPSQHMGLPNAIFYNLNGMLSGWACCQEKSVTITCSLSRILCHDFMSREVTHSCKLVYALLVWSSLSSFCTTFCDLMQNICPQPLPCPPACCCCSHKM